MCPEKLAKVLKEMSLYISMPMSTNERHSEKIIYSNYRNSDLIERSSRIPDSEIPKLLRLREEGRKMRRNIVRPRKRVRELIQHFEANPIIHYTPPPVSPPRGRRVAQLTEFESAFRGFDQSYNISLVFTKDPLQAHAKIKTCSE